MEQVTIHQQHLSSASLRGPGPARIPSGADSSAWRYRPVVGAAKMHAGQFTDGDTQVRTAAVVGAVVLGALLIAVGAIGARWLGPGAAEKASTVAADQAGSAAAAPAGKPAASRLELESVRTLLAVLDPAQRKQVLESKETFEQFIKQEALNRAVLAAAAANGADDNPTIRTLMDRAGQRVLAETYLNQVVRTNLDPAFPSEAQVREAYDNNPDAFRVPERLHLWQIFIPLNAGAPEAEFKKAWQLADRLSAELRAGKADFAAVAKKYSAHEASRLSDGYMGLLKTSELLPPVAEAAAKLKAGQVSEPVATESGLHILRRGATVAAEMLEFDKIAPQVRERLLREAAQKVRDAAVEKIVAEFPVDVPSTELDAWRSDLADDAPVAAPAAPLDKPATP